MISKQRARLPTIRIVSGARQVFRMLVSRLPSPVQQRATSALRTLAARWPRLAGLVGMAATTPGRAAEAEGPFAAPDDANGFTESEQTRATSLEALRYGTDFVERIRAARVLARIRDEESTLALATALRDTSAEVAVEAAEALGKHRGHGAIRALRAALDNSDGYYSPMTRAASVRSLGALLPSDQAALIATAVADVDPMGQSRGHRSACRPRRSREPECAGGRPREPRRLLLASYAPGRRARSYSTAALERGQVSNLAGQRGRRNCPRGSRRTEGQFVDPAGPSALLLTTEASCKFESATRLSISFRSRHP